MIIVLMLPRNLNPNIWFNRKNYIIRGVSHCGLANFIKKYHKAKEELWKLKYLTMWKYNLPKNPLKETKILQDMIAL